MVSSDICDFFSQRESFESLDSLDFNTIKNNLEIVELQSRAITQTLNYLLTDPPGRSLALYSANFLPLLQAALSSNLNQTLGILFLICDHAKPDDLITDLPLPLPLTLFNLVLKLADGNRDKYSIKKIMMLLDKTLAISLAYEKTPRKYFKVSRDEFDTFLSYSQTKYPAYAFPKPNFFREVAVCPVIQPFESDVPSLPIAFRESVKIYDDSLVIKEKRTFKHIDQLYQHLLPQLPTYVATLVRLIYYVNLGPQASPSDSDSELDVLDHLRQKHIMTLAMSNIFLAMLRGFKQENYISSLLSDNNCAILVLKMLSTWFQNPPENTSLEKQHSSWLEPLHEPPELFPQYQCRTSSPFNTRTLRATTNLLSILHFITKQKTHRILSLVLWKSGAVLKRILKVYSEPLQHYTLKLLKSQIPFLGRKWRNANMKVVSAIYVGLNGRRLKDEYLGGNGEVDADPEKALATEQQNRAIVNIFHAKQYPNSCLAVQQCQVNEEIIELDSNFQENYQEWLDAEVYGGQEVEKKLFRKFSRDVLKGVGAIEGTSLLEPSVIHARETGLWKDLVEDELFGEVYS